MKHWLIAVSLICFGSQAHAAYFDTLFRDPTHPKIAVSSLFTPKFVFDGAESDVALVFHKADPNETIIPQRLLDAGVKPVSWTLLEAGAGGDRHTGFASVGPGIYVAGTLLGPLTALLEYAGGTYATVGKLLVSPDGGGLRLGIHWKANAVENGALVPFNHLRFAPRYVLGYSYQF